MSATERSGRADGPATAPDPRREARTLRRALLAGAGTAVVVGGGLAIGLAAGGGAVSAVAALLGLALGLVVASGWLLLAALLDLVAGQRVGRARIAVTGTLLLATALVPLLVAAAGG